MRLFQSSHVTAARGRSASHLSPPCPLVRRGSCTNRCLESPLTTPAAVAASAESTDTALSQRQDAASAGLAHGTEAASAGSSTPGASSGSLQALLGEYCRFNNVDVHIVLAPKNTVLKIMPVSGALLASHAPCLLQQVGQPASVDAAACKVKDKARQPLRKVKIRIQKAEDEEALERCMGFMYGKPLPQDALALCAAFTMAQRIGMHSCAGACVAAICQQLSVADTRRIFGSATAGMSGGSSSRSSSKAAPPSEAHLQQMLYQMTLMHRLGDVAEVMRVKALRDEWAALPHARLLELLHSEALASNSEDSVMAALFMWLMANPQYMRQAAHQPATQQLVEALRLRQLSPGAVRGLGLCAVDEGCLELDRMAEILTAADIPASTMLQLAVYVGADAAGRQVLAPRLPAAWLRKDPRPSAKPAFCAASCSANLATASGPAGDEATSA